MSAAFDPWEISTDRGVVGTEAAVISVLAEHQRRLIDTWRAFSTDDWSHPTRNADWSVHETVRHLADMVEHGIGWIAGDPDRQPPGDFDPRTNPVDWLDASSGETPEQTIERYERAAATFRSTAAELFDGGHDAQARAVFGPVHWSINVLHVLWDAWLHERDILLPLGRDAATPPEEQRLIGVYSVLPSLAVAGRFGASATLDIVLDPSLRWMVTVEATPERVRCSEVPVAGKPLEGDPATLIDAIGGRGQPIDGLLPDAPSELGLLAAVFNS